MVHQSLRSLLSVCFSQRTSFAHNDDGEISPEWLFPKEKSVIPVKPHCEVEKEAVEELIVFRSDNRAALVSIEAYNTACVLLDDADIPRRQPLSQSGCDVFILLSLPKY